MISTRVFVKGIAIAATDTTYYTAGSNTKAVITKANFVNDDTDANTITINIVPSGESVSYANRIIKAKTLAAGEAWSCTELVSHVIDAGGFISMKASTANKIGCRISGYEVT